MKVFIEYIKDEVSEPHYKNIGDAGMDICAAADVTLQPGETAIVPVGFRMAIPFGYEVQIRPRSGISVSTPLRMPNSIGTVDSGFRGEIGVPITNTSKGRSKYGDFFYIDGEHGEGTYKIRKGDRIAQMVLCKHERIEPAVCEGVSNIGEDRGGGFGSTGVR